MISVNNTRFNREEFMERVNSEKLFIKVGDSFDTSEIIGDGREMYCPPLYALCNFNIWEESKR